MKGSLKLKILWSKRYMFLATLFSVCTCMINPYDAASQDIKKTDLMSLVGYYQLQQNKNMYLQINVKDGHLQITQLWDSREVVFDRKSDLTFENPQNPMFTLEFTKDDKGEVVQLLAFNRDIWDRDNAYKPQPAIELSADAIESLKTNLKKEVLTYAQAINSNSSDQISAFYRDHIDSGFPVINFKNLALNTYKSTGGIDFYNVSSFQAGRGLATFLFKGKSLGNFYEVSLVLNKDNKISMMRGQEVYGPAKAVNKPISEKELISSLNQKLNELCQKDIFSGTVLLAKGDRVLLEYACGEAIKPGHEMNLVNTRFNLGSMNKMFTATSIMQLLEKGKLKLDDPISKYIDTTWLPRAITDKVTIHHLLSHSSGLGDFFGQKYDQASKESLLELNAYKPFIKENKLAFEPGTNWSYSNSGMILLGVIIEKVSGKNYFDYVRENIYKKAGMKSTDSYNMAVPPSHIAYGYIPQSDGSYHDNNNSSGIRGSSAGGGYSTVNDLHKFGLALLSGNLVSESSRELMFTDHFKKGYGYGFQLQSVPDGKIVGHSGGAPGINGVLHIIPEKAYYIVVLTNYDRAAQRVGDYFLNMVIEAKDRRSLGKK